MYDAAFRSELAPGLQRARGALRVAFKTRDGRTVLDRLRQDGALKARFPRPERGAWTGAVMLNSSGGVASGDVLSAAFHAGLGTRVTVAAQAAERIYRSPPGGGPAVIRNSVAVEAGAALEWLPQETILFDRCALDRRLHVALARDARFLGVEALVFGRMAMGESVGHVRLRDVIHLEREGVPLLHDAVRMEGAADALMRRAAIARSARCLATIVFAADDAADRLGALRDALADAPGSAEFGASAWDGLLVARILAADGAGLRAAVVAGAEALRDGRPLPRVWLC